MGVKNLFDRFPRQQDLPSELQIKNGDIGHDFLINGKIKTWDGPVRQIHSPVFLRKGRNLTSIPITQGAMLTRREALDAVDAACSAYDGGLGVWPKMTVSERIKHVRRFIEAMKQLRSSTVTLEMWEIAKSLKDCEIEFDRTVSYLEKTVECLADAARDSFDDFSGSGITALVRRAPLGMTLCMGPYNVPIFETLCTAVPAILMGNTVVIKLPRLGILPLCNLLPALAENFPAGVVNVIDGDGQKVVTPIMESGAPAILAFVGTSRVANIIRRAHPLPNRLRKVLALDAKNPAVVLDDADIESAVAQCVQGAFAFNGQRCTGIKHVWVHRSVESEFLTRLCTSVSELKIGMPWDNPDITPLAEPDKPRWLAKLIEDATRLGAKIINQGGDHAATLFSPAVLHPVSSNMEIAHVEQFGPVLPVTTFDKIDEVYEFVRSSNFGQQISLFGENPEALGSLIDLFATQVSRINVNTYCRRGPDDLPFTGRKDSAESVLSVRESLRTFSTEMVVTAEQSQGETLDMIVSGGYSKFLQKSKSRRGKGK